MKHLGVLSTVIGFKKLSDFCNTLKNAFKVQKLVVLGMKIGIRGIQDTRQMVTGKTDEV